MKSLGKLFILVVICAFSVVTTVGCPPSKPRPGTGGNGTTDPTNGTPPTTLEGVCIVSGTVSFSGNAPSVKVIDGIKANDYCRAQNSDDVYTETCIIDENNGKKTVRNAIVYIERAGSPIAYQKYPTPKTNETLDQKGCIYVPHVGAMRVKQPLNVLTSDSVSHNVKVKAKKNETPNWAYPAQPGYSQVYTANKPEFITFSCNVHPWMSAWWGFFDHPYFGVTDNTGKFTFKEKLPPGKYTVKADHEYKRFKTRSVTIEIKEGQETFEVKGLGWKR